MKNKIFRSIQRAEARNFVIYESTGNIALMRIDWKDGTKRMAREILSLWVKNVRQTSLYYELLSTVTARTDGFVVAFSLRLC